MQIISSNNNNNNRNIQPQEEEQQQQQQQKARFWGRLAWMPPEAAHQNAATAAASRRAKSTPSQNELEHEQHHHENNSNASEAINFWHYKQTGIRSRPIKLLTHPIEHIERKIIITYLLGFMFKFVAILTGPIIVLIFYLIALPFKLIRRLVWFLLNISFLCDARIRTTTVLSSGANGTCAGSTNYTDNGRYFTNNNKASNKIDKQIYWNYCPLDFIETYWFKEKLVNNVILVIEDDKRKFSIDKLRKHLRENVLVKPEFRKFLSKVVSKGIPFYKGHYWHYLGISEDNQLEDNYDNRFTIVDGGDAGLGTNLGMTKKTPHKHQITSSSCSSSSSSYPDRQAGAVGEGKKHQLDGTSVISSNRCDESGRKMPNPSQNSHFIDLSGNLEESSLQNTNKISESVNLRHHVYMDQSLAACPEINLTTIRRYAYKLLNIHLDLERPLWELRAIESRPSSNNNDNKQIYIIFRCHQSLADGKSLSKILTEHLTVRPNTTINRDSCIHINNNNNAATVPQICLQDDDSPTSGSDGASTRADDQEEQQNDHNHQACHQADYELKLLKEKESFVSRISEANSCLSAIFVGPLTVLLWIIWSFTRRKNNHLNKCLSSNTTKDTSEDLMSNDDEDAIRRSSIDSRRFYMTQYDLTKFHQIKQMTRSTVSDVILCALSGALRDYLRKFNAVSNPPNLNISLTVDMRQPSKKQKTPMLPVSKCDHQSLTSTSSSGSGSGSNSSSGDGGSTAIAGLLPAHYYCQEGEQDISKATQIITTIPTTTQPKVNCTLVNVPIPTSVEGTVPRLWDIRGTMEELRTSADPWVMLGLQRLLFEVLPSSWYRSFINHIALGNSSTFVSNIQGPQNMVESWCVDLFQRALMEARQAPKVYMVSADGDVQQEQLNDLDYYHHNHHNHHSSVELMNQSADQAMHESSSASEQFNHKMIDQQRHKMLASVGQLVLIEGMGNISAMYYCMQPPTSNIPISFNCITYHSKLFVTALSRSLLVEDSKLLIDLFFRQLDQLADTVARRRSLITIIQGPAVPIEVQPSSPTEQLSSSSLPSREKFFNEKVKSDHDHERGDQDHQVDDSDVVETNQGESVRRLRRASETISIGSRIRSQLFSSPKDDLETDIGSNTVKCQVCLCRICVCRRRNSLFIMDATYGKERMLPNSSSSLRPVHSRSRRSLSPQSGGSPNEMRSLEDLGEEDFDPSHLTTESKEAKSIDVSPEDLVQLQIKLSATKPSSSCTKRGAKFPRRSTLSLDFSAKDTRPTNHNSDESSIDKNDSNNLSLLRHSDQNFTDNRSQASGLNDSDNQLIVPSQIRGLNPRRDGKIINQPMHSRSETDLLPSVCRLEPTDDRLNDERGRRGSAASWLTFVRRQKFSRSSKSSMASNIQQIDPAARNSLANLDSANSLRERRGIFEAPLSLLLNRRFGGSDVTSVATAATRRRSAAAGGGSAQLQRSIIMRDEMNSYVSLRYHHQLEGPMRSIKSRRFSTIVGSASGVGQRRASLIPFGLMQNKSLPKMFWEDTEVAHV